MSIYGYYVTNNELYHHGVKGMKWGIRRYQNKDGSLTAEGEKRYYKEDGSLSRIGKKIEINNWKKSLKSEIKQENESAKELRKKYRSGEINLKTYIKKANKLGDNIKQKKLDLSIAKASFVTKDQKLKLQSMTKNTVGRRKYRAALAVQSIAGNVASHYVIHKAVIEIAKRAIPKIANDTIESYNAYAAANQEAKAQGFENWKDKRQKMKMTKYGSYREISNDLLE